MSRLAHPWTMKMGWSKTLGTDPGLLRKPSGQSRVLGVFEAVPVLEYFVRGRMQLWTPEPHRYLRNRHAMVLSNYPASGPASQT